MRRASERGRAVAVTGAWMRILMLTNTYTPHVGGVARSVSSFAEEYRRQGHDVLVVAPEFENLLPQEPGVLRVPALERIYGSDFSLPLPVPGWLSDALDEFGPEVVHSHHPFLLGDTALRISAARGLPVVFTNHTQYERYTHYLPFDSPQLRRFVQKLAIGYANLCHAVIAPSMSIRRILEERGVRVPVAVIPTGIDLNRFSSGDGRRLRSRLGLHDEAFVVGHVGRLAPEKNLGYLGHALAEFLALESRAHVLVAGEGPAADDFMAAFAQHAVAGRLHRLGRLNLEELADVYAAMDVFAFASQTETQGIVLVEALAAGTPLVALDAPGVRDVLEDGVNGSLLPADAGTHAFAQALADVAHLSPTDLQALRRRARTSAQPYAMPRCARQALDLYEQVVRQHRAWISAEGEEWPPLRMLEEEWSIWTNFAEAMRVALLGDERRPETPP